MEMLKAIPYHLIGLLAFMLLLGSCGQSTSKTKLEFDHVLLFANNKELKDSLDKIFTPAEKLTTEHKNQGTVGYYYLFYNTYIELLFLKDSTKATQNKDDFGSNYLQRWGQDTSYCPIGFGMLMKPWDTSGSIKNYHIYQSADSPNGEYYFMSNYNQNPSNPFVYISQPHRAYDAIESIEETDKQSEEIRADLRKYLTHSNNSKRITQIIYNYTAASKDEEQIELLQESTLIDVKKSNSNTLTLVFDGGKNKQNEFMLNDQTKLIIKY